MSSLTPNAQRLLRSLISDGPAYRADLARALDVSRATVTNLTGRLQADGWIEEPASEPGSLKSIIGTAPKLGLLASVMFLVDTVTVTLATLDGRVLKNLTLDISAGASPVQRVGGGADLIEQLLAELDIDRGSLRALHLAVDTQMDALTGDVYAPRASSRWFGVNPKQYFAERFGVPVYAQNTARLEGLAEYLWGAGQGHDNMLYVDVSYGVTSGHVIGGIIQSGARGGSGELGHTVYDWNGPLCTCGNCGCLMQYVSIPAMLRDQATGSGMPTDWRGFVGLMDAGDPAVAAIVHRAAVILARVLVNTCHLIDPEVLVLSGEVVRALPSLAEEVAAVVKDRALPLVGRSLEIVTARLEDARLSSARAGIESLRAIDDIVTTATAI